MNALVTVREYARITTEAVAPSLDCAQVPVSAFDWLCRLNESFSSTGASLVQVESRRWLKLDNYVGVLETPCGTRLEILPKHHEAGDCVAQSRALLRKLIQSSLDLPTRRAGTADLELFDAPLSEWVMQQFLEALDHLLKRGLRFDYCRVEEEQRFLRGQLNVVAQLRQPPGRQHQFQIRHDLFVPDRPENRLLKLALDRVCKITQNAANWRLAHELRSRLMEVPACRNVDQDFRAWRADRLMAHYQPVKPWCQLILHRQMPLAVAGDWHGISLLFPMEKLFERHVGIQLRKQLPSHLKLTEQAASQWLCVHRNQNIFQMRPDFLVQEGDNNLYVMDAKWKLLSSAQAENKYGLSQGDFYQLFAYGHKYLGGIGEMLLIYPRTANFLEALPPFDFSSDLRLWVAPFDLDTDEMLWPSQWSGSYSMQIRRADLPGEISIK